MNYYRSFFCSFDGVLQILPVQRLTRLPLFFNTMANCAEKQVIFFEPVVFFVWFYVTCRLLRGTKI